MQPCRRLACENCRAGGRADGRCGVGVGETQTLGCQAVDARCFVERTAVTAQIPPAEVVGKDEQDIGRRGPRIDAGIIKPDSPRKRNVATRGICESLPALSVPGWSLFSPRLSLARTLPSRPQSEGATIIRLRARRRCALMRPGSSWDGTQANGLSLDSYQSCMPSGLLIWFRSP